MPEQTTQLQLGPSDGWLRDDRAWQPEQEFYAVLGDPLAHSLFPRLQAAAMRQRGLSYEYLPARIPPGELNRLKTATWSTRLAGFNVTAPLKEEAYHLCDMLTPAAQEIGAVNTVSVHGNRWRGHNTDSGGVLMVLSQAWPAAELPPLATVFGTGAAARAAVTALARWGVESISVRGPSPRGRDGFRDWLENEWAAESAAEVVVSDLQGAPATAPAASANLWIVCLAGRVEVSPFVPDVRDGTPSLLLDLRYREQLPSPQLPSDCQFVDGEPVLLMQGGLSFAWWFGPPVPWEAMRQALIA
jgi:shikimate dehydrogenase